MFKGAQAWKWTEYCEVDCLSLYGNVPAEIRSYFCWSRK